MVESAASHAAYAAAAVSSNEATHAPPPGRCSKSRFASAAAMDVYDRPTRTVKTTSAPEGAEKDVHAPSEPVVPFDVALPTAAGSSFPSAQKPLALAATGAPPATPDTYATRKTGVPGAQSSANAPVSSTEKARRREPSACAASATLPSPQPFSCVRWHAFQASTHGAPSGVDEHV